MHGDEDDANWWRPLLIGVGALLGVAVLVGGLIGVLALGAANVAGIGGSDSARPSVAPSLYRPSRSPTPTRTPAEPSSPTSSAPVQPEPSATKTPKPKPQIALSATSLSVAPSERIDLTGVYPQGEGVVLQVQRFENGWVDFPTSATVRGGIFTTYVLTGRTGVNRFRVYDVSADRASNPVSITVR